MAYGVRTSTWGKMKNIIQRREFAVADIMKMRTKSEILRIHSQFCRYQGEFLEIFLKLNQIFKSIESTSRLWHEIREKEPWFLALTRSRLLDSHKIFRESRRFFPSSTTLKWIPQPLIISTTRPLINHNTRLVCMCSSQTCPWNLPRNRNEQQFFRS